MTIRRIISLLILIILINILNNHCLLAWSPITHVEISRQARGSQCGSAFLVGSHSPDMIVLRHVTTGNEGYDYAHKPESGNPTFGRTMIKTAVANSYNRYSKDDLRFAQGWVAHQLADSIAHGSSGYVSRKNTFSKAPSGLRSDLSHGLTELIVDAIVLKRFTNNVYQHYRGIYPGLIHEASVFFYNDHTSTIERADIISCHAVESMTRKWEGWLQTNAHLAKLVTYQPWFNEAEEYYSDFKYFFDLSVSRIRNGTGSFSVSKPFINYSLGDVAYASDIATDDSQMPRSSNDSYRRFMLRVTERARELGDGTITDASIEAALKEIIDDDMASNKKQEVKTWAFLMQEIYLSENPSFKSIIRKTTDYTRQFSQTKKKEETRWPISITGGILSFLSFWLLPFASVSVATGLLIWVIKKQ